MSNKPMRKAFTVAAASMMIATGFAAVPELAQAQRVVVVQEAPPPPRHQRHPKARRGYVWEPAHWVWRGNHYVWVEGRWLRERRGYAYRAPEWREHDGRWEYSAGRWDRDGDGVPNRVDSRPDDPRRH